MASIRVWSARSSTCTSPSAISPDSNALASIGRSDSFAHEPTQSVWYIVCPVAGRTWPTTSHRPVVGGDVQQQVGEAEVGQHAPLRDEADEVLDLVAGE